MKKLESIIKKLEGRVVCYGIDDEKIIDLIDTNDKIYDCDLLNCDYGDEEGKARIKYIKSIKKRYKKKRVDYMIIKVSNIDDIKRKIVADSVFVTKNKVILYDENKDYDIQEIIEKYKRYDVIITEHKANMKLIEIDTKNVKPNRFKDMIYYIKDTFDIISEKIDEVIN